MEHTLQKVVQVSGESWVTVDVYGEQDEAALVIIPGVMSDALGWREVARNIEGWSTVAVVNRRARQPSGPLTAEYSLQSEVDDAAAVLREFTNVETLFGWSYG